MKLYLISNGQSINNARWNEPDYEESPDPVLTEIGQEQAHILGEYLKKSQDITEHQGWNVHNRHGFGITHIYTSLMERAAHTASFTARRLPHIPFVAWEEIHESGGIFGREGDIKLQGLPGKTRSFFEEQFPELKLPASLNGVGWWNNRPFETEEECQLRAQRVWAELLARHGDHDGEPEQRVVFVSHGGFFGHLVGAMLNMPWRQASNGLKSWFVLNNCSISRFDIRKGEVLISYLNRTDHLPSHLITG
jgi:2,3-bisphosphoglycerate-dependent phosphoglycerate mutase